LIERRSADLEVGSSG